MSDPTMKAIRDWVFTSSGLVADSAGRGPVVWARNKAPRPSKPYIAVSISAEREHGAPWTTTRDADDPQPGADLEIAVTNIATATLTLECFAVDHPWEVVRPEKVLSRVLASRNLPTRAEALRQGGVGFGPVGAVQLDELDRGGFTESLARATIVVHLANQVSELGTWMESIETESDLKTSDGQTVDTD